MSDNAQAPVAPKSPKKKASKPKKPATHPKYSEMVKDAIQSLKERGGSSRQAILKYIMKKYNLGTTEKSINSHLKLALRAGVNNKTLKQSKGTGASGSFRIGEKSQNEKKPKKKPAAKKAKKPKKAATPKKAKKPAVPKPKSAKKTAKPKKAATPKKAKKPAAKKPAAKKPAAKKPAAKKPAAKKAAKKPAKK